MLVNPITGPALVTPSEAVGNRQPVATVKRVYVMPEETVTLSPAAQMLQTEQRVLAYNAQNKLSPSAQALQNDQGITNRAAENGLSPTGQAAVALWRSALALISE